MADRPYTAEHVIGASPWDVWELLVSPIEQQQWRDRYTMPVGVADEQPYTRVEFTDGTVMEIEPEGSGTLLRASTRRTGNGSSGRLGRLITSRRAVESDLLAQLKRIGSLAESGGL